MPSFQGTITTLAPLSHNSDESFGVDTKFRRLPIVFSEKIIQVPVYSGNAFRGILRRIAAKQFFDDIEYSDISEKMYYTFFCGGMLQKGSNNQYEDIGKKRQIRENIPFLSIFGSAIQNMILPGKLQIGMLLPIVHETSELTEQDSEISVFQITEEIFYTRRDDKEDKETKKGKDDQSQQMKYSVESIIQGVSMAQKISIDTDCEIEICCFSKAMKSLMKKGVIGGKSGVGHGQCKFEYSPDMPNHKKYDLYISQNKEKIKEFVREMEEKL